MLKKAFIISSILLLLLLQPISSIAQTERFSMSYLYFGSPTSYVGQVDITKGSLEVVSPSYFDLDENGRLQITWKYQKAFVDNMHKKGVKVVPFLSNHWDRNAGISALLTEEARQQLAESVASRIDELNLDGVNVDIEGVGRSYENSYPGISFRDNFTDLIKKIREQVPKEKEVSVAVAANPNGWSAGWHGFYDYKALSQHADYLMVMAYDESWEGTPAGPGPVSSFSFVDRSIQYGLNQGVPKEKLVIGIPFYGRIWKTDGPTAENVKLNGRGLSNIYVEKIVGKFNGTITYSETKQTPEARFTIPEGQEAYAGSLKLTPGDYIIWFENARSLKHKLRLINKYDLKGAGSWSLIQEAPYTWDFYSLYLNGRLFSDLPENHWAEEDVFYVSDEGWMNGTGKNQFSPNESLTRAQGAVILVRALGLDKLEPKERVFTDTKGHWAADLIEIAREYQLVDGVGHQKYAPDKPLTREQLAKILQNIFNYSVPEAEASPFADVSTESWAYEPILAMKENGIITGFDDGTFKPVNTSSRVQMAALMSRLKEDIENKMIEFQ